MNTSAANYNCDKSSNGKDSAMRACNWEHHIDLSY
jgi:hypothetical protein